MDPAEARTIMAQLRDEGFSDVFVWTDRPDTVYPDHTHATETAHVVMDGAIDITTVDGTRTFGPGERFDVPAETVHSAQVGPTGCTYVVGER